MVDSLSYRVDHRDVCHENLPYTIEIPTLCDAKNT